MNIRRIGTTPTDGTDAIHTVTIGGTPTGGTFIITTPNAGSTAAITWSSTTNTLIGNVQAALDAIYGANNTVVADSTLSSGVGDFTVTFTLAQGRQVVAACTFVNSLTGTSPTLADVVSTAGVEASFRGAAKGQLLCDYHTDPPTMYWNTSNTASAPTWSDFQTP